MLFTAVRVILALAGAWLFLGVFWLPAVLLDRAWGAAFSLLISGIIGAWLFRVGLNGTLSGSVAGRGRSIGDS